MHVLHILFCLALPATVLTRSVERIIGGITVPDSTTYPFMASLRYFGVHSCGAALIGSGATLQQAVTSAQCVGNPLSSYELMAGTNDRLCRASDCTRRPLTAAVRHPDFIDAGFRGYPNDIAIVSVSISFTIGTTVRPITLDNGDVDHKEVTVMGWGRLSAYGNLADYLQYLDGTQVLTGEECNTAWSEFVIDYQTQICVLYTGADGAGMCNGDSGGPMIIGTNLNSYRLVGVMSWTGIECDTTRPTVFTRVSAYADWITGPQ